MMYYILSTKKDLGQNPAVVKSIVSTQLAKPICDAFGVELFDTLTGFKFIGEMIQEFEDTGSHTFLFGFEGKLWLPLLHLRARQGRRQRKPFDRRGRRLL